MTRAFVYTAVALLSLVGSAYADRVMAPAATPAPPPLPNQGPSIARRRVPPTPPTPSAPVDVIAAAARPLLGNWTCKGVVLVGDGSSTPYEGTLSVAIELDGAWLHGKLAPRSGVVGMKVDMFRTFDAVAQEWTEMSMASNGAHHVATSTGEANGTWTWVGSESSSTGTVQRRDYETQGATVKLWGERLLGGSWQKAYEISCAR
jgi:hypothetical protein